MPSGGSQQLPDHTRPETTGRELSFDEMKEDIIRLRDVAQRLRTHAGRLEGLFDIEERDILQRQLVEMADQIDAQANHNVSKIKAAIFKKTGDKGDQRSDGRHEVGGRKFR